MLKLKKSKTQKAITLIALIITIVVLLILAAVAIAAIQNENILGHANNAAIKYNQAVANEQDIIGGYLNYLDNLGGSGNGQGSGNQGGSGGTTQTVANLKNTVLSTTSNKDVYDEYGNKIVVPAGFKILVDDTTNNADTVTEGIVIEHGTDGNQFVWIPVGTVYTNEAQTTSETITLGRYSDFSTTPYTPAQTVANYATATTINTYYTEDTTANHNSSYGNSIARSIGDFVTSATQKGGYYLGRYEAGDSSNTTIANRTGTSGTSTDGTLVCKANQVPYNWILQADASSKCQSMYADGYSSGTFSSDLINSYAWDTAIIFIQTFGTKTNSSTYASTIGESSTSTSAPQTTGTNILNATSSVDEQLNIYDVAGNCREWSTETSSDTDFPCVYRGGSYGDSVYYTRSRINLRTTSSGSVIAFRPLLYVGL